MAAHDRSRHNQQRNNYQNTLIMKDITIAELQDRYMAASIDGNSDLKACIGRLIAAAMEIESMQCPSVPEILSKRHFNYEAGKVEGLTEAAGAVRSALNAPSPAPATV